MAKLREPFKIDDKEFLEMMAREDPVETPRPKELVPVNVPTPKEEKKETEEIERTEKPEIPKEDNRRRRSNNKVQDYENTFIKESPLTARLGKAVNIRPEYHERLLKLLSAVYKNEISIFSYIDNVLTHHFDTYEDEINGIYVKETGKLY